MSEEKGKEMEADEVTQGNTVIDIDAPFPTEIQPVNDFKLWSGGVVSGFLCVILDLVVPFCRRQWHSFWNCGISALRRGERFA